MKKVLIASPTADVKSYCFDSWLQRVKNLTYGNYDIHIVDNSENRDYYSDLKQRYKGDITIERVSPKQYPSFKHTLAMSHEKCRQKAIREGYDYLFHLESDIFPPVDVIEQLMSHNKSIVGGLYHIELGEQSKLMIQEIEGFGMVHRETFNLDETDLSFVDGELKRVFSCGLGCILMKTSAIKDIPFRYESGAPVHPDSFFFGDLNQAGKFVFADTSVFCEHDNQSMTRV